MSDVIQKYIRELKAQAFQLAADSMMFPKPDPFAHGEQCGNYQGLNKALELLNKLLHEEDQDS